MKKKKIVSILQLALGVGMVVLLLLNVKDEGDLLEAVRTAGRHWGYVLTGLMIFFGCLLVCAMRWRILLEAQGLHIPIGRTLSLFFIGHFFNSFLFGVTGGDVVKAYYVTRETHQKKTEAVSTIFLDRIVGLLALVGLIVIIMLIRLPFYLAYPETRAALIFFGCVFVGSVLGIAAVFGQDLFDKWSWSRSLRDNTRVGSVLARVYAAFQIALTRPGLLAKTVGLSVLNHIAFTIAASFLGKALEIDISIWDYLSTMPIINALAAIPLTPGGLGTREVAAKVMMGTVGVPGGRAVLLSLLCYGSALAWSLVGGLVYIFYSYRAGRVPPAVVGDAP